MNGEKKIKCPYCAKDIEGSTQKNGSAREVYKCTCGVAVIHVLTENEVLKNQKREDNNG